MSAAAAAGEGEGPAQARHGGDRRHDERRRRFEDPFHTLHAGCARLAEQARPSGEAVTALQAQTIEPVVAIARTRQHRAYDAALAPDLKPPHQVRE